MSEYEDRMRAERENGIRYGWLRWNLVRLGNEHMTAARLRELTPVEFDRMVDEWMRGIK